MTAYLVVDIKVHDADRYQEYVSRAPAFVEKHSGRYIVRGGDVEVAEGSWQPERLVVVRFPSKKHAHAFLDDPDYQAVATIRQAATDSKLLVVDGYEDG